MNIKKFFTYKKVATIHIKCSLVTANNEILTFVSKCKLYENHLRDRKINMDLEYYPLTNIKNKVLLERFINGQCTPDIPSRDSIVAGINSPVVIYDEAVL